jgi:hypothetical protein
MCLPEERQASESHLFRVGLSPILEQMSIRAKKILITTERSEVTVIRQINGRDSRPHCPLCGGQIGVANLETAHDPSSVRRGEELVEVEITESDASRRI